MRGYARAPRLSRSVRHSKAGDMSLGQSPYDVSVEWGVDGLATLVGGSDVVIIVDVLSFSTCVDVAVAHGGSVFPCALHGNAAAAFASKVGAECATPRGAGRFSLSPATFTSIRG